MLGHINNVAFAALFETARTRFNAHARLWGRASTAAVGRAVVAMQEIHYLAEASYPDDVTVATGVGRIGNRSWTILAAMFQSGRPVATCDAVIAVPPGPGGGGLSDAFRRDLAAWRVAAPPD